MSGECAFPFCEVDAQADQLMCRVHARVTLSGSGSRVPDKHTASEAGE